MNPYRYLNLDPLVIWPQLPFLVRIESLFLVLVAIYSLYRLVHTLIIILRLRRRDAPAGSATSVDPALTKATERRMASLRSLHLFAFYLFALLFFVSQIPDAFTIFGDSNETGAHIIFRQLGVHFGYAADILLLLLLLHSFHWIMSSWFCRVRDGAGIIHS